MKQVIYENIYNKERFVSLEKLDIKSIDGVDYVKVKREGSQQQVLVRRDFLKKVNN